MAGLLLPITTTWLVLGCLIDLRDYTLVNDLDNDSIFKSSDYSLKLNDTLRASYYVIPRGQELPYSALGIPVDLVLRERLNVFPPSVKGVPRMHVFRTIDLPALLFVIDYGRAVKSLKEDAVPIPGWQNSTWSNRTHYVEELHYGGRMLAMYEIETDVLGDAQIVENIMLDHLGPSGTIDNNTLALWNKTYEAVKESSEIRSSYKTFTFSREYRVPLERYDSHILEILANPKIVWKYVDPYNESDTSTYPMAAVVKELRNFDKNYPELKINLTSVTYWEKLYDMLVDCTRVTYLIDKLRHKPEIYPEFHSLQRTVQEVSESIRSALNHENINIRMPVNNVTRLDNVIKQYYDGLSQGGEKNYTMVYKKLTEDKIYVYHDRFFKPVKGFLSVEPKEVDKKGSVAGGLEECQELCFKDPSCKAVGFAKIGYHIGGLEGKKDECWIYYRSTYTATIYKHHPGYSGDMAIYDRYYLDY